MTGGSEPEDNLPEVWLMDLLVLKAGFFHCRVQPKQCNPKRNMSVLPSNKLKSTFLMLHNLFRFQNLQYSFEGRSWDLLFSKCFNASE